MASQFALMRQRRPSVPIPLPEGSLTTDGEIAQFRRGVERIEYETHKIYLFGTGTG